jgi:hypothetical protein
MKIRLIAGIFVFLMLGSFHTYPQKPIKWVNPFIGASTNTEKAGASHGLGKTFPGAATRSDWFS